MARETVRYAFDDFVLDVGRFQLLRADEPVHLEPRVLDVLLHLVVNRDHVVTREELLDSVWKDRFVSESALTSCLKGARRALGDSGSEQRMIRTVQRRGYQFVADVTVSRGSSATDAGGSAAPVPPAAVPFASAQQIRFCTTPDNVRIAYAVVGSGPVLLKAANWLTHLDLEWSSPVWGHWLRGLGRGRTLVRYDERGCGLSDWEVGEFSFQDWVDDLATVVDAVGLDRFPLIGISQGGAVAIAYAVAFPERVSHLILAGAYARGRMVRARTPEERQAAELDLDLARVGWGRADPSFLQVFASQFLPDGTVADWKEFTAFQQRTTSPDNAVRFLETFGSIDVSDLAPQVDCPTLILHARDDVRVPASSATELAALIPGSHLVLLDGHNHLLTEQEPAWEEFLRQVDRFLAE